MRKFIIISILVMIGAMMFAIKISDIIRNHQDKQLVKIAPDVYVAPNVIDKMEKIKHLLNLTD